MLSVARERFARDGYARTTIRLVAADAGVDVAQVMQFFRSKDELFAAVMSIPASALERFSALYEGPDEHLGERVVRAFLAAWTVRDEESGPLMATLRGAFVNDQARNQLRGFIQSRLLTGTREYFGSDARLRAGIASSLLVGLVVGRRVLGVPTLENADPEELVRVVAPAIQRVLAPQAGRLESRPME
ncbi:TetR/AcrR family transcriptional regulator [Pseudomonas nicosulfuronedens]